MKFRKLRIRKLTIAAAAALLIGAMQPAVSQIVTKVAAHELSPQNIILPGSVNGMVTFRSCGDGCDEEYSRARLTADTRFSVDGRTVKFEDFRKDFAIIKQRKRSYALLSVDVQTKTITSIQIQG
ncbi:MAG: hypothetical protein OER97_09140 [Gammaproteobacteria bacterium]|nr:hypothetical protein [Gammaproteobacteria bacterium]